MEKLVITLGPKRRPMGEDYFIAGLLVTAALFFLWGFLQYPAMRGFIEVMLTLVCLAALVLGLSRLDDWLYNRDYPELLQKHLESPLSAEDYEQLARMAKRYPELQPWIAAVMDAEGQIRYRDAEHLKKRINQYLRALPQKELHDVVRSRAS